MPRTRRIIELTVKRREDGSVGGPLYVNFEATEKERLEAFGSLLAATLKVSGLWNLDRKMLDVAKSIVDAAPALAAEPMRVNTRDEKGVKQPLDRKTAEALAQAGVTISNIVRAAPRLLAAGRLLVRIHNELAEEVDKGVVDAAFERWDAGMQAMEEAVAEAEGRATEIAP